jgi:GTPase
LFHDRARIEVLAGRGGDGGLSFRREKHVPKGGPDGGDGGRGGDVVLVADDSLRDLSFFRAKTKFRAGRGEPGRGARKHGADGATIELAVPVGTQAYGPEGELIADLALPDARVVLARGGQGGRGNARFATPVRQTPRFAEVGEPAGEADVELRLKLLADAAMAGLPNAGKSSLLRRLSNAKPKVAEYPFTTLAPVLGTVEAPDGAQLTVADVPGLIEGASEGIGLGHEFLAHLERARLLLHVIDASADDVDDRFRTIDRELALYGAGLDERPQAIVLNKIDLLPEPPEFSLEDSRIVAVFRVSAATGEGIEELKRTLFTLVPPAPVAAAVEEAEPELVDFLEYRPQPPARRAYRIYRTDRGYRIAGDAPQGAELEAALTAAGIRKGQDVEIGDETLEWG